LWNILRMWNMASPCEMPAGVSGFISQKRNLSKPYHKTPLQFFRWSGVLIWLFGYSSAVAGLGDVDHIGVHGSSFRICALFCIENNVCSVVVSPCSSVSDGSRMCPRIITKEFRIIRAVENCFSIPGFLIRWACKLNHIYTNLVEHLISCYRKHYFKTSIRSSGKATTLDLNIICCSRFYGISRNITRQQQ